MADKLHALAESIRAAYAAGEDDEAMLPRVLADAAARPIGRIGPGEIVIFYDIRGEREIELTQAFTDPGFNRFDVRGRRARFYTMIEYHSGLAARVAFPPEIEIRGTLIETVLAAGRRVAKVVESEKSIHLTYFLNGKRERPFAGEKLVVVESPKDVANHDAKPEMAAAEVVLRTRAELEGEAGLIVVNFANVDVVGHIENPEAVVKAVETVDRRLGQTLEAAARAGVPAIVTADHGTVEKWLYPDGKIDTGHTDSPVPFILIADGLKRARLRAGGDLTDVAPTVLHLLGLAPPPQMTGRVLIEGGAGRGAAKRLLLVILDGWGHRDDDFGNMIKKARTPVMDRLRAERPWTTLAASGEAVGMPAGKVGNSESGHLHLGAGRRIWSDRIRIDRAIADGSFRNNPAFVEAIETSVRERVPLHFLGIVSFYSSHGSVDHLYELLRMAKALGAREVYHHGLLGRRGERPEAGARYVDDVERFCAELGVGRVVTVMGRFWALDREHNWDRVEKAYRALADGEGVKVLETA